jgi:hypothetical protein
MKKNVTDILDRISKLNSVFGIAAKMCANDPAKANLLVKEYYNEIMEDRKAMEEHFGSDLVKLIINTVEEKSKKA